MRLTAGSLVFLDTAPFIYLFERHPEFGPRVEALLGCVLESGAQMITSTVTYLELAAQPARRGDLRLVARYREYLTNSEGLSLYPISLAVADAAITYRARYGFRTPDSLQLAVAEVSGADYVITNDADWRRAPGLDVRLVSELALP